MTPNFNEVLQMVLTGYITDPNIIIPLFPVMKETDTNFIRSGKNIVHCNLASINIMLASPKRIHSLVMFSK